MSIDTVSCYTVSSSSVRTLLNQYKSVKSRLNLNYFTSVDSHFEKVDSSLQNLPPKTPSFLNLVC